MFEDLGCFVSWEADTTKNSLEIPGGFHCNISRHIRRRIHRIFLESGQGKRTPLFPWHPVLELPAQGQKHFSPMSFCGVSSDIFHAQYDWTTGVPGNGIEWRKFRVVPCLYPCVPLFSTLFNKDGNRRAFRLPGAGGDHVHCTLEPSPGHIRSKVGFGGVGQNRSKTGRKHMISWVFGLSYF